MLDLFFKYCGWRNFSTCNVWKSASNESKAPKPVESPTPATGASGSGGYNIDFVPNEFDKKVLVWSGRYKSKDEIPPRVSYSAIDNARSRVRIKLANLLMLGTLCLCGYYIWQGKKRAKAGDSIVKMEREKDRQILERAAREKALKGA